jgi:hypothetical protein
MYHFAKELVCIIPLALEQGLCFKNAFFYFFKGSLTRDFRLQVSYMNQCPPGPQVFHWGRFEFFRKFVEIFANDTGEKFIAGVNDTGD